MDVVRARRAGTPGLSTAGLLLASGTAYYIGSLIGLALRLTPAPPSILWPPNALLTAALLLTSPARWPIVLLGALTAHVAAQLPAGRPLLLVLGLFVTNCTEALIAAGGVRLVGQEVTRLDTVRRFGAFLLLVVVMAPLLSTFADAAVVTLQGGAPYWPVWRNRLVSNMLSQLIVTPAAIGIVTRAPIWFRRATPRQYAEAALLVIGLVGSGWLAFRAAPTSGGVFAAVTNSPLVMQLPFVLWAALRFGPTGTSLALFGMTGIAAWTAIHLGESFQPLPSEQLIPAMQVFFTALAVMLLGVATLVEERRASLNALGERLRFETLLSEFSRTFVQVRGDHMDAVCLGWFERLGLSLGLDCVRLYQRVAGGDDITEVSRWKRPGFDSGAPLVVARDFPWILHRVVDRQPVALPTPDTLPADAARDRASLEAHGYSALLVLPLLAEEQVIGAIAFGAGRERPWPDELTARLQLLAEVLANSLARRQTHDALNKAAVMKSAILGSLPSGVAVVDAEGRLLDVNTNWRRFAEESRAIRRDDLEVGDNLLDACSGAAVEAIRSVLNGSQIRNAVEYTSQSADGTHWWQLVVTPLNRPERGGAVVTLEEITEARRAEIEAQQVRQQLAHVGRVSTMGELTASLAHELKQPLTAIMGNAQAARRLLDHKPPDYVELRNAMSDIVDDARRASDIIQRVRELSSRGRFEMTPVDLGSVIRDVANLVSSDAIISNVSVTLDLEPDPVIVRGDHVQLQQVVLNLLVNAIEAVAEEAGERTVRVSCRASDLHEARVVVRDSGGGFAKGADELVFDPFYTTKAGGMGMGLSIARSIIEAHGGSIRAHNGRLGGTIIEFTLPSPQGEAAV
ncbi:MAG TPA: MASE1 domain-containing protein [Vicinamibacterales bacterium]|nr:MASE1 domain-containing protein [Vicinamibacterales bacterium]